MARPARSDSSARPGSAVSAHPPRPARIRRRLAASLTGTVTALALALVAAPAAHAGASGASGTDGAAFVTDPASLVDPFIGTTNSEDVFPGADVPYGMVQWSPDTPSRPDGGGYEYADSSITGFSLTHLSGPGCLGEGDVPILPTVGAVDTGATDGFSHADETASPGSYSVALSNGVTTRLTVTPRSGMASFTFPSTTQANLVFKLDGSQTEDSGMRFHAVSDTEVSGQVTSGNFCDAAGNAYTVYFDMVFDHPFASSGSKVDTTTTPATTDDGYVTFDTTSDRTVLAKVGVSFVSTAGAVRNRTAENPGWDFSATQAAARASWNSLLGKVRIAGGTSDHQTMFYTALYHASLHPNIISDVDGRYPGFDGSVQTVDPGHSAAYANYSGWDTYRSQAQLEALTDPQAASDAAQSMIDDFRQTGRLPKWSEEDGEAWVMVGDPADAIFADDYAFGARNFDTAAALGDMIAEATIPNKIRPGLSYLEQLGYLPTDGTYGCCNFYGPAATTLEYDTADFAISAFAGALGYRAVQNAFVNRAQDWRNLFNQSSGFIQPRNADGSWTAGFDPDSTANFVEENAWQYTLMIPFDLHGLATAMGGNSAMETFLLTTLLQGHVDMGNEPALDIPWEFDYTGAPYDTQDAVRQIQDKVWNSTPAGLPGNDDLGEMSSWYVWSALGMYPETPGTADLALGSPLFPQIAFTLPSGNTLTINSSGVADASPYVQSASWNGADWDNAYAPTDAITSGGTLDFTLGSTANTSWATAADAAPPSYPGNPAYTDVGAFTRPGTAAFPGRVNQP